MNLELLANQGKTKVYSNLAGRNYSNILAKRTSIMESFACDEVEHKQELVARIKNVDFINDAKSITPNATWFTMESISNSIVWVAGGEDITNDYTSLIPVCIEKVRTLIVFGDCRERMRKTFSGLITNIVEVNNMRDAVIMSKAMVNEDEVVLYSPASGHEQTYADRGEEFRMLVNDL